MSPPCPPGDPPAWRDDATPAISLAPGARPPASFPPAGTVLLGRYQVLRLLAEGGQDAVAEGLQLELERPVAIKMLHRDLCADANAAARFQREARLAAQLYHPNTVTTLDFGRTDDGALFIVREFLFGRSLYQVVTQDGAQPWRRTLRIARQICGSLCEAHDKGISHRDLKLGDILLLELGRDRELIKVADYVNWRLWDAEGAAGRDDGDVLGFDSSSGVSDAALKDELSLDPHGDIRALGALLCALLTGTPPQLSHRAGSQADGVDISYASAGTSPDLPAALAQVALHCQVPKQLEDLLAELLFSAPRRGCPSMGQALRAVEGLLAARS